MGDTHVKNLIVTDAVYEDIRFPTQGVNPPGVVNAPSRDTDDGCLVFSATAVNMIAGIVKMPHSWKTGTTIYPHIHVGPQTNAGGKSVWEINYQWINPWGQFTSTWTSSHIYIDTSTSPNTDLVFDIPEGGIDASGKIESSIMKFKISRIADSTSDNAPEIKMLSFDIHHRRESIGTREII